MASINKDFSADLASIGMTLRATGFIGDYRFVTVVIRNGVDGSGEYRLLVYPDEARAIAETFMRAADFAESRVTSTPTEEAA